MNNSSTIITAGLTKHFGGFTAVNDLSLDIKRGEIYGFLGLNGAGKTTTIRMLLGMIKPSAGSVSIFGMKVQPGRSSIWQRIGYLVETPHHYPDLTVRENLEIVRRLRLMKDAGIVEKTIQELGLAPYAGRRARTLSLGNSQRLGLAKALIHHPGLLILDEPANALDPAGIVEVRNLIRSLAENEGVTIFISSHILSEIARIATRIGIIHEGRLVKEIDAAALVEQEERRLAVDVRDPVGALTELGRAGVTASSDDHRSLIVTDKSAIENPDRIAALLVRAGFPPTRLVVEQTDLESYFLDLVGLKKDGKS
jgi:ABC-2 type transport system ATP-binding protein